MKSFLAVDTPLNGIKCRSMTSSGRLLIALVSTCCILSHERMLLSQQKTQSQVNEPFVEDGVRACMNAAYGRDAIIGAHQLASSASIDDSQADAALMARGRSLISLGQTHAAETVFELAVRRNEIRGSTRSPGYHDSLFQLARTYLLAGNAENAIKAYRSLLDMPAESDFVGAKRIEVLQDALHLTMYLGDTRASGAIASLIRDHFNKTSRTPKLAMPDFRVLLFADPPRVVEWLPRFRDRDASIDTIPMDIHFVIANTYVTTGNVSSAKVYLEKFVSRTHEDQLLYLEDDERDRALPFQKQIAKTKSFWQDRLRTEACLMLARIEVGEDDASTLPSKHRERIDVMQHSQEEIFPRGVVDFLRVNYAYALAKHGFVVDARKASLDAIQDRRLESNPRMCILHALLVEELDLLQPAPAGIEIDRLNSIKELCKRTDLNEGDRLHLEVLSTLKLLRTKRAGASEVPTTINDIPKNILFASGSAPSFHNRMHALILGVAGELKGSEKDEVRKLWETCAKEYHEKWLHVGVNFPRDSSR